MQDKQDTAWRRGATETTDITSCRSGYEITSLSSRHSIFEQSYKDVM